MMDWRPREIPKRTRLGSFPGQKRDPLVLFNSREWRCTEFGGSTGHANGQPNLSTELVEELGERISVREGGNACRVSKQRALLKALIAKGLQGDVKAMTAVLALGARAIDPGDPSPAPGIHEQEVEVLKRFLPDFLNSLEKKGRRP